MHRFLYFAGFTYIALCGVILVSELTERRALVAAAGPHPEPVPSVAVRSGNQPDRWFAEMKPYCNAVEVESRMRFTPPPRTNAGAGLAAACYGLAGKIERARAIIEALPRHGRGVAASALFNVAHPAADAGDDRSSGPMMELVLEYWPNNYMALYHAGMSAHALGQADVAKTRLRAFLSLYSANDGFTTAARSALARMEQESGTGLLRLEKTVERDSTPRP